MERRRTIATRPASSEEVECWEHAAKSLSALSNKYSSHSTVETIERVNRLINAWPPDDTLPAEGYEGVKTIYKKILPGLADIRLSAEEEVKAIEDALEHVDVLKALRTASEASPLEKRNKRPRVPSPIVAPTSAPTITTNNRSMSITLPARNSAGPGPSPAIPFSRDPKARREALSAQLPLQEGRKVAFHPPPNKAANGGGDDENTWILALVTRCIHADKNRYEVQDADPQEDGSPGILYNTTLKAIIPLPDPNAPAGSPAHVSAYQEFPVGSVVMALYPDTSCFYRAEVIATPKDMPLSERGSKEYKLKFEDDDNQEHTVDAQWVVEWPNI